MPKSVSKIQLFLIGLSAGLIAALFPRLLPLISQSSDGVTFSFFNQTYFIGVILFALIIGISMIWLYMDSKDSSRQLFMSALALPAIISGGLNVSSVSSTAEQKLNDLENQTIELQSKLESQNSIPVIEIEGLSFSSSSNESMLGLVGISTAFAQDLLPAPKTAKQISSVGVNAESLNENYIVVLMQSPIKQDILSTQQALNAQNIKDTILYEKNNLFYLMKNERTTKTKAIMDVIEIKNKSNLKPSILKVK